MSLREKLEAALARNDELARQNFILSRAPGVELQTLALKIADSCARSDIECNCNWVGEDGDEGVAGEIERGAVWYNTDPAADPELIGAEWLTDALRYLELRGLLIRNEDNHALVRVKECHEERD